MSRELRARLESAQGRQQALRRQLATFDPQRLTEEDKQNLSTLYAERATLEGEALVLLQRRDDVRHERDQAQEEALRFEPRAPTNAALAAALMLSLVSGVVMVSAWAGTPWATRWPAFSFSIVLVASGAYLLRDAWWLGRASAARRDGMLS